MNDLHGIIFAYRESPELRELTRIRNACSVPYGGRYRLIDFALSNLVNAGVSDVGIIVYNSYQSLLDHVGSGKDWDLSRKRGQKSGRRCTESPHLPQTHTPRWSAPFCWIHTGR